MSNVQEVAVPVDGIKDEFPFRTPTVVASAKSRLPNRIGLRQIRPFQFAEAVEEFNGKSCHLDLLKYAEHSR